MNDYPTIFFLGILTKAKGVSDLIRAVLKIKQKIIDVKLLIGGSGPYEHQLKQLVTDYGLEKEIQFLGFLDDVKKFSVMKSIDLFVLPSLI